MHIHPSPLHTGTRRGLAATALLFASHIAQAAGLLVVPADLTQPMAPAQIGIGVPMQTVLTDTAPLHEDGWRVWQISLQSPGAESIALDASLQLPPGSTLTTRSGGQTRRYGPEMLSGERLVTVPMTGDMQILELRVPGEAPAHFALRQLFAIPASSQAAPNPKAGNISKADNTQLRNYLCDYTAENYKAARSLAEIFVSKNGGLSQCSAHLVNNAANDGRHYLLTAEHCGETNYDSASVTALWVRETSCGNGLPFGTDVQGPMSNGYRTSTIVKQVKDSTNANLQEGDNWLMVSDTPPPEGSDPYWAGIYLTDTKTGYGGKTDYGYSFGVHHPTRLAKSYARSNQPLVRGSFTGQSDFNATSSYRVVWDENRVDNGSSGSALFKPDNLILGTLAACNIGNANTPANTTCYYTYMPSDWEGNPADRSGLKHTLDPSGLVVADAAGETQLPGREDSARRDRLSTVLSADVATANGSAVTLRSLSDNATTCTRSSTPGLAAWGPSTGPNNGVVETTAAMIPDAQQYTLSLSCTNAAGYSRTASVVVNKSSPAPTTPGSSNGAPVTPNTPVSNMSNSSGGGGAFGFVLLPLLALAVLRRRALRLSAALALTLGALTPMTVPAQQTAAAAAPQPPPQIKVADLTFTLLSLRVSNPGQLPQHQGYGSLATIAFQITNNSDKPKALNFVKNSAIFVNDIGYPWTSEHSLAKLSGLPVADGRSASSDNNLEAGGSINASMTLGFEMQQGQTIGNAYDLQFSVVTYKDLGEGKVIRDKPYSVQFVNMQRMTAAASIQDAGQGLKKALGGLFN